MSSEKAFLREEALRHRARLEFDPDQFDQACALFFESFQPAAGQIVSAYCPKGREFDPGPILDHAARCGVGTALPVIPPKGSKVLAFYRWQEGEPLEEGPLGILQPGMALREEEGREVLPDFVLVPLLVFDRRGHRLGYGGGYYDATLRALRAQKEVLAIGIGYAEQACLFPLPTEEHDERLDYVLTPQAVHDFRPKAG